MTGAAVVAAVKAGWVSASVCAEGREVATAVVAATCLAAAQLCAEVMHTAAAISKERGNMAPALHLHS